MSFSRFPYGAFRRHVSQIPQGISSSTYVEGGFSANRIQEMPVHCTASCHNFLPKTLNCKEKFLCSLCICWLGVKKKVDLLEALNVSSNTYFSVAILT